MLKGNHHKEETKIRISKTCKERGVGNWLKGQIMSDNAKEKIRLGHLGLKLSEATKLKIGNSHKGIKFSKEHIEKLRKSHLGPMKGKKHPNWQGGISFEPYAPEFNGELKTQIRKRDNYTCQMCGKKQENSKRKLSVHHINYNKKNNDLDNLITLCISCNNKVNFQRGFWLGYFYAKMEERRLLKWIN